MPMEFKKDRNRNNGSKPINETKISQPKNIYKEQPVVSENNNTTKTNKKMGRPRKNKVYATLRVQKDNVLKINAVQNALGFSSQDDMLTEMINSYSDNLSNEEKTMFNMYLKTFKMRENNK